MLRAERLDVLTLPLRGSRVIEASAGTGKTWTLAALVLRLVLGDGRPRPLHPREVLVMSFTRAATRELVERIRERLAAAAVAFREPGSAEAGEPIVAALLAARPGAAERAAAARLLARAAEAMDEAAVHTIDAWCQRVLREHAFDSGSRFDEQMLADESELRRQAIRDWWRAEVYPLEGEALALLLAQWKDVERLEQQLAPLLKAGDVLAVAPAPALAEQAARRAAELRDLKSGWVARCERLAQWFEPRLGKGREVFIGQRIQARWLLSWLAKLRAWALDPAAEQVDLGVGSERLRPEEVQASFKPGQAVELPVELNDFAMLMDRLAAWTPTSALLLPLAHAQISGRLATLKRRAASAGFADLQRRLADALDEPRRGAAALRLRAQLRARYPVALVDECQDSSPVQMTLFERVWGLGHDDEERTLLLIGDPKQSIYRFRGADIQGFLRARAAAGPRVHGLDTNYRSTAELVAVVNAVFQQAEEREPDGAFRFGRDDAGERRLPFLPVRAHAQADHDAGDTTSPPALTVALDREVRGGSVARERLAAACAQQVLGWLADRRWRPRDVAVLVRNKAEADEVRRALGRRGLRAVYLSEKDSVFAEPEAADLLRLLHAVADPSDGRRVRAALATAWVGSSLAQLQALADDDALVEAAVEQLWALRQVWQQQGVLATLRHALQRLPAPGRWRTPGAERVLTNTLHLAELLQAASEQHAGEAALLRWLAEAIDEASRGDTAPEDQLLRLESDDDLVQVVTVHKSKGLEYPLVCVPFASLAGGARKPPAYVIRMVDGAADGRRELCFTPDAAALAEQQAEEDRESLRLLYVALTRARQGLWLGLAAARVGTGKSHAWARSALGWLISGEAVLSDAEVVARAEAWARALPHTRLQALWPGADDQQPAPEDAWSDPRERPALRAAPALPSHPPRPWAVGSYSGFVRGLDSSPARGWRDDEPVLAGAPTPSRAAPWHRFERGPVPGQLLHTQLEWLAGERFALAHDPVLGEALRGRLQRQAPSADAPGLVHWLARVCETPLPALGSALAGLPRVWPELEFWLPVEQLDAGRVDHLCRAHVLPGRERPALPARRLRGLLMGFADLVYQHPDGRWGVLDHKSNALGDDDAAYTDEAITAAVLQHRYDVQAALYLLALHRLLRHRLGPGYRPQEQLHGAVFLFLRGIAAPGAGAWRLDPAPALIDGLDAMFSGAAGAGP